MRHGLLVIVALCTFAGPARAEFGFDRSTRTPVSLFDTADAEIAPSDAEPPFPTRFGVGLWFTYPMRVMNDPWAMGGALGAEFLWPIRPDLGLTFSAGFGWFFVDANRTSGKYAAVQGFAGSDGGYAAEFGVGGRYLPLRWRTGALYSGSRLSVWIADGLGPVDATTSLGAEIRLGIEMGKRFRASLESGIGYRVAMNQSDAGWLEVGYQNGIGGLFIEILRIGVRFYI